jgi:hypothetical protein
MIDELRTRMSDEFESKLNKINENFWDDYWENYYSKFVKRLFKKILLRKDELKTTKSILFDLEKNHPVEFNKVGLAGSLVLLENDASQIIRLFEDYDINFIRTRTAVFNKIWDAYCSSNQLDKGLQLIENLIEENCEYYINSYAYYGLYSFNMDTVILVVKAVQDSFIYNRYISDSYIFDKGIMLLNLANNMVIKMSHNNQTLLTICDSKKAKKQKKFLMELIDKGCLNFASFYTWNLFDKLFKVRVLLGNLFYKRAVNLYKKKNYYAAINYFNKALLTYPFITSNLYYYNGLSHAKIHDKINWIKNWELAQAKHDILLIKHLEKSNITLLELKESINIH